MRGFSLVELMIALLISSLLVIGVVNVFAGNQAARRTQESLSEIQNNGRVAINWLKHDLRMAGNTALTYSRSPIQATTVAAMAPTITNNCFTTATQAFDWALAVLPPAVGEPAPMAFGLDNVTTSSTVFSGCIDGADLQAGSDILSVHFAAANPVADADLVNGNIYLDSGVGGAVVFKCNADGATCLTNLTDARTDASGTYRYPLVSRVYFVRSWANAKGDGIPALVRADMQPGGVVVQEVLMAGVTSLQVLYGMDTDNDGEADRYQTASQLPALSLFPGLNASWTKIKSVRLSLLLQSTKKDGTRGTDVQTFNVGASSITLPGRYVGKVFTTTVALRNPSARIVN